MEEAKRKELYSHHRSIEASSSSSIVPSQMSSDEVRNWQTSSFPLASPGCIRPSILGSEVLDSPLSCMKVHNIQADLVPYQNSCDIKERALLDSRPSKVRKKLFDRSNSLLLHVGNLHRESYYYQQALFKPSLPAIL